MTKTVRRRLFILVGAVALLAVVAFGPSVVSDLTKKKASAPALATAAYKSFPVVANATGTLFPQSLEYVNFAAGGRLSQIKVAVGTPVAAGQVLAQLDPSGPQAALTAAQAALSSAEAAVATATANGNSQQLAAARAQVASAEEQVQQAHFNLSNTVLTSPEAATVLQVNAQVGETVNAGVTRIPSLAGSASPIIDPSIVSGAAATPPFIVLGSPTQYQVSAAFSEASAAQLAAGQPATIVFDALPGLTIRGTVGALGTSATQVNGVPEYYASILATGTDPRLRNGMTVNVSVDIAQANNVLTVPSQAVFTLNNGSYVDVWYKSAAVATPVTTGLIGERLIQVTSGLTQGEQVVLSAGQLLPSPSASSGP